MLTRIKIKLTLIFTVIVGSMMLAFGLVLPIWQTISGQVSVDQLALFFVFLVLEVVLVSSIVAVIGYFFTAQALKPAELTLQQMEQFVADASHQLQTPLTLATSNLELAKVTGDSKKYLPRALANVGEASKIIKKLMQLALVDNYQPEMSLIDLDQLVQECLDVYSIKIQELQITPRLNLKRVRVKGDVILIGQLLTNLIDNAIKFNHPQGSLSIVLSSASLVISNSVNYDLEDIELNKITDRFFRAPSASKIAGQGIGLAIVQRIARLLSWDVNYTASQSEFTVRLQFTHVKGYN